jgi:hypothetical protein
MICKFAEEDAAARGPLPELTQERILAWADEFHGRNQHWPSQNSGPIKDLDLPGESWLAVEAALALGLRGLPGGDTLPRILARERGRRNKGDLPDLTLAQILRWADAHHRRTGEWPKPDNPEIPGVPGESWHAIDAALNSGLRGLPGGSSLPRLLLESRDVCHHLALPKLSLTMILAWADAHHAENACWPTRRSGLVAGVPHQTWSAINAALREGVRGLPGGSSLARLLSKRRGVLNRLDPPKLSVTAILQWADRHHRRTGQWPNYRTHGKIPGSGGTTWSGVRSALESGSRGLPGGSSLAQLLAEHRCVRNTRRLPALTAAQILRWADAHHDRTGVWPKNKSGPIADEPEETWGG